LEGFGHAGVLYACKGAIDKSMKGAYTLFTERERERERERESVKRVVIFNFKRNDGCLGTF
jgi:hypothetical protein